MLHETLLRGKASALPTLKTALRELEARLHWTRERRAQIVLRLDGGFGTTATLNWLLSRGYQLIARGCGPSASSSAPGSPPPVRAAKLATGLQSHRFGRTTRQWMIRTPKDKGRGYQYAALLTTLPELAPTAVADAYHGRARL